ncbi:MAG: hypothetical protein HYZ75_18330 [Elusimicrobia bacterium]|nr:hypothetical protein [Elusimicrobiota bacterium]
MFTNLGGVFRCLRCGADTDALIQTYLFKTTAENAGEVYRVGEGAEVDGIEEFIPLYPWDGRAPLEVAVGDWDCGKCRLNWQWAKLTLTLDGSKGTILALTTFLPKDASDFNGIHRLQRDLADLAGEKSSSEVLPPGERAVRIAAGFKTWCREVAGVEP